MPAPPSFARRGGPPLAWLLCLAAAQARTDDLPPSGSAWPGVNDPIRAAAQAAPLRLRFEGRTADELAVWQQGFARKLNELIGASTPPAQWVVREVSVAKFSDHIREELLLMANDTPSLPLYILRPRQAGAGRFPIVLCLHGHGVGGHDTVAGRDDDPAVAEEIRRFNYDYGRQLVREGYLVVAPCFAGFGRRLEKKLAPPNVHGFPDSCAMTFLRLQLLGRTAIAENLRDVRWALDYAIGRPEARADRVGCLGISYGARVTTVAAALDRRIKTAVVSCNQSMYQHSIAHHVVCGAENIPGILQFGDTPEIASLIAPRPVLWDGAAEHVGSNVPLWKEQGRARLERAYRAAGAADALVFHAFPGKEAWNNTKSVEFLARVLKSAEP